MRRRSSLFALLAALAALAPASASAAVSHPSYYNRAAPTLPDGVHGPGSGSVGGVNGGASSSCRAAKRAVTRAKRKIRSLKRRVRRTRSSRRRRALNRSIRRWRRKLSGRRRAARRRCAGVAQARAGASEPRAATASRGFRARSAPSGARAATTSGGAHFRSGAVLCENGQMGLIGGPDIRSQSPAFVQGVTYSTAVFRWNGSAWVFAAEFPDYWWTVGAWSFTQYPYRDSSGGTRYYGQGFSIFQPGLYRLAVRYHWAPNPAGAREDTSWNWAGTHSNGSGAAAYCTYV